MAASDDRHPPLAAAARLGAAQRERLLRATARTLTEEETQTLLRALWSL